jgi:curved DNA-binding protein CbpA
VTFDSGRLAPLESYVLSRIDSAISISEIGAVIGIPEADAHKAVCALVAAGFLKVLGRERDIPSDEQEMDAEVMDRLREDIARRMHFYASADHYEVLGLSRQATTAEVKSAYYHLAKKFHPDRYRHSEQGELQTQLESLLSIITQAYDTLTDNAQRTAYDERIRKSTTSGAASAATPAVKLDAPAQKRPLSSSAERDAEAPPQNSPSGSLPAIPAQPAVSEPVETIRPAGSQARMAEQFYNQGRALLEKKQYHGAVHMLREAIKLDPSRAPYHFHLGMTLVRNPRTRHEAEEHLAKAAELDPYNVQIRVKLGLLYKEVGLAKKSNNYFKEALSLDPDNRIAKREFQPAGLAAQAKSIWKSDVGGIAKKIFKK